MLHLVHNQNLLHQCIFINWCMFILCNKVVVKSLPMPTMSVGVMGKIFESVCLSVASQKRMIPCIWYREWPWDILQVTWFWVKRSKVKVRVNRNTAWVRTLWVPSSFFVVFLYATTRPRPTLLYILLHSSVNSGLLSTDSSVPPDGIRATAYPLVSTYTSRAIIHECDAATNETWMDCEISILHRANCSRTR